MAVFIPVNDFKTQLAAGTHAGFLNADTDVLKVCLTDTLPVVTNTVFANITEIAAGNGYVAGGFDIQNSATQTNDIITVVAQDVTVLASGGAIPQFQYAVVYSDTAANKNIIGWYASASAVNLADASSFVVDFGATFIVL